MTKLERSHRDLYAAVLQQALDDLQMRGNCNEGKSALRLFREAREWICGDGAMFKLCCVMIDLEPERVRNAMLATVGRTPA